MPQIQANGGKQQRKRNRQRNDKCAASVAQQNEKNDDDQDHSFGEIVENGVGGVIHQIVPVEIRDDFYSGWKYVVVEPLDHGVDALQHLRGVRSFAEKHDTFDHVVVVLDHTVGSVDRLSNLTKTNLWPLGDHGHVFDSYRSAVLRLDHGFFDVTDVLDQSHGAHIDRLRSLFNETAAGVGVAVGELLLNLRQAKTVRDQLLRVHANLVFLRNPAEGRVVHHIGDRLDVLVDDPILQRLELHHVVGRIRALQRVPIDLTHGAVIGANLRAHSGRKCDLRKTFKCFLAVPVVVGRIVEDQVYNRQPCQRHGPQVHKVRNSVHLDFDGYGDLLLDLFRGPPWPLGDDLHPSVRHIGISLDWEVVESDYSPEKEEYRQPQDDKAVVECEIDKGANHHCSAVFWNSSALLTTCWPGVIPEMISCIPPGSMSPPTTSVRRN